MFFFLKSKAKVKLHFFFSLLMVLNFCIIGERQRERENRENEPTMKMKSNQKVNNVWLGCACGWTLSFRFYVIICFTFLSASFFHNQKLHFYFRFLKFSVKFCYIEFCEIHFDWSRSLIYRTTKFVWREIYCWLLMSDLLLRMFKLLPWPKLIFNHLYVNEKFKFIQDRLQDLD